MGAPEKNEASMGSLSWGIKAKTFLSDGTMRGSVAM